jgi:competence protein ComEA
MAPEPPRPPADRRPLDAVLAFLRYVGPLRLIAGVVTAAALVAAGVWLLRAPPPPVEASLPFANPHTSDLDVATTSTAASATTSEPSEYQQVVVHVAGAVATPGLVTLPVGARVADALAAAGGPVADADTDRLNLAQILVDGVRVHVPVVGEAVATEQLVSGGPAGAGSAEPGPVDVNTAGPAELERLPGVGPATARAIIDHRERHGPFRSVEDLLDVRGIGPAKLDAIRDLVTT